MNIEQLEQFIERNSQEKIDEYYRLIYQRSETATKSLNKTGIYMSLIIIGYLLINDLKAIEEIDIGPIVVSDITVIKKIVPAIFCFFNLRLNIIAKDNQTLQTALRYLHQKVFNSRLTVEELKGTELNDTLNMSMPYSMLNEIIQMEFNWTYIILLIPVLLVLLLAPISFVIYSIYSTVINYPIDYVSIIAIAVSVWLYISSAYYSYMILKKE